MIDDLIRMLNTLLSPTEDPVHKKKKLEQDFRISMEGDAGKEMDIMCNLSGYVWQKGLEEGISQGLEQGINQGRKETAERMLQKKNFSYEEIAEITGLTKEAVQSIEEELMVVQA